MPVGSIAFAPNPSCAEVIVCAVFSEIVGKTPNNDSLDARIFKKSLRRKGGYV